MRTQKLSKGFLKGILFRTNGSLNIASPSLKATDSTQFLSGRHMFEVYVNYLQDIEGDKSMSATAG